VQLEMSQGYLRIARWAGVWVLPDARPLAISSFRDSRDQAVRSLEPRYICISIFVLITFPLAVWKAHSPPGVADNDASALDVLQVPW